MTTVPLCDLVVLVWNHLEDTRQCVESLRRCTDVPSRLLIVDNGSDEPTRSWLDGLRPSGPLVDVTILRNATNEGYPRGMNRGLKASTAPYVCLLNNDLVLTPGWLSEMLRVADADPRIGLVNPSSNTLDQRPAPRQRLDDYAAQLVAFRGQWIEMGSSIGFCMLIKREVQEKVGLMDVAYGMAFFEDTDYARRAQAAGYLCVRAKAAYVHHLESRSVVDLWPDKRERRRVFDDNAEKFYARWGKPERQVYVIVPNGSTAWVDQETLRHANQNSTMWVLVPADRPPPPVRHHMNIAVKLVPPTGFALRALWRIVIKKKKFDRIVLNHRGLAWMLQQLRWLHRAQIDVR